MAFGSDTGGSIRIPAACCGVAGLKTTRGRVALDGVLPLAPSLDTVGPMAATIEGIGARHGLAGTRFRAGGVARNRSRGRDLVVGRVRLPAEPGVDAALDARPVGRRAARRRCGPARLVDRPPRPPCGSSAAEAWQVHQALWRQHAAELSPDVSARLHDASSVTPPDLAAAWQRAERWDTELAEVFARVDVLALPTLAGPPPTLEDATRLTDIRYVAPFNLAGVPALALPVRSPARIPPSLQLVGPAMSEELLVAVGAAVEAAAGIA